MCCGRSPSFYCCPTGTTCYQNAGCTGMCRQGYSRGYGYHRTGYQGGGVGALIGVPPEEVGLVTSTVRAPATGRRLSTLPASCLGNGTEPLIQIEVVLYFTNDADAAAAPRPTAC